MQPHNTSPLPWCRSTASFGLGPLAACCCVVLVKALGPDAELPSPTAVLQRLVAAELQPTAGGSSPCPTVLLHTSALPVSLLALQAALQFGLGWSGGFWTTLLTLLACWAHLRFFTAALPTSCNAASSEAAPSALLGDRSDRLLFVSLLPAAARPAVGLLLRPLSAVCLRLPLFHMARPAQVSHDGAQAAQALFSFSSGTGGTSSPTHAAAGATAPPAVRDPVAERRRARALALLDAKLAAMSGSGRKPAAPGPKASPSQPTAEGQPDSEA